MGTIKVSKEKETQEEKGSSAKQKLAGFGELRESCGRGAGTELTRSARDRVLEGGTGSALQIVGEDVAGHG